MDLSQARKLFSTLSITQICDASPSVRIFDSAIKPYIPKPKMLGKAFTVMTEGDLLPVLYSLQQADEDHVIVLHSGNTPFALAGEIFTSEAKRKNIAGIVIDGFCRDAESISQLGLPFYARGTCPKASTKSKLGQFNIPIQCGGVNLQPTDIILGDENGLIALAPEELEQTLEAALLILKREESALQKISAGSSLAELTNFEEHYSKIAKGEESSFQWK